jgi:hypothetical protein
MVEAGANLKGQMRHSRISTTMDIYAQFMPESQRARLGEDVGDGRNPHVKADCTGRYTQYFSAAESRMVN